MYLIVLVLVYLSSHTLPPIGTCYLLVRVFVYFISFHIISFVDVRTSIQFNSIQLSTLTALILLLLFLFLLLVVVFDKTGRIFLEDDDDDPLLILLLLLLLLL